MNIIFCMDFASIAVVCFAQVASIGICAGAYYLSEQNKARIQQEGITFRAMQKVRTDEASGQKQDWWVPIATELLKNPSIQNLIMQKVAPNLVSSQDVKV